MTNTKRPLRARVRAATDPTPSWSITDPATLAAVGAVVSTILTVFFHVGHPGQYVQLGMLIVTGIVVPVVAYAKHRLALGGLLADLSEALQELAASVSTPTPVPTGVGPVDHSGMKLGRAAKREDARTFKLADYATTPRWRSPAHVDWTPKVAGWPMMANDRYGDCTCASAGHLIEEWTAYANPPSLVLSDEMILAAYSAITGFNPSQPNTDQGANELDVLNYWRQVGIGGRKITAYAALDVHRRDEIRYAVSEFGGAYTGIALPITAQHQAVWDVDPNGGAQAAPGSWGGHAVPYVGYTTVGPVCITWGQIKQLTWAFHRAYCEEAYVIVSPDWFPISGGRSPGGFDLARLMSDLSKL